jgi:hypothetical protein
MPRSRAMAFLKPNALLHPTKSTTPLIVIRTRNRISIVQAIENLAERRFVVGGLQQKYHGDNNGELKQGKFHCAPNRSREQLDQAHGLSRGYRLSERLNSFENDGATRWHLRSVSTGRLNAADELAERALTAAANFFFCAKVACDQLLFSTSVRGRTSRPQTAE